MKRYEWTPERLAEIHKWRVENEANLDKTAEHFGLKKSTLYSAMQKHKVKQRQAVGKPFPANKPLKFIDVPQASMPLALAQVAVVFCSPDQLAQVLRGVK